MSDARVCPACQTAMEQGSVHSIALDRCAGCGSVWFDNSELSEAAGGRIDVEMLDVDSPRRCPACKAGMEKARVKGQDVETCSECGGVFLEGVAKDGLDAVGALLERLK